MQPESRWHPTALICANLLAILLFASWLLEPTRSLWLALDDSFFWATNGSLAKGELWREIWAVANHRAFDLVAALSMFTLYGHYALLRQRENLRHYIAIGLFLTIAITLVLQGGKLLIPIERPSATMIYSEALRLSELVPYIETKDSDIDTFPGDHGLVLLLFTGFILYNMPRIYGVIALLLTFIFTVPRLMSGAHWLSDELVGAIGVGSLALGWIFATPLHDRVVDWLERKLTRKSRGDS
jgi:membrane-associated phospholipid phosphatase